MNDPIYQRAGSVIRRRVEAQLVGRSGIPAHQVEVRQQSELLGGFSRV